MFDIGKMLEIALDADDRLSQIANQQRITNGLLAMLVRQQAASAGHFSEHDKQLFGLITLAFGKPDFLPFSPTGVDDAEVSAD